MRVGSARRLWFSAVAASILMTAAVVPARAEASFGSRPNAFAPALAGHQLWVRTYPQRANVAGGTSAASGVAFSPDAQRVYVTGSSQLATGMESATVAYRADGGKVWTARYRNAKAIGLGTVAVAVSPDGGRVFVSGWQRLDVNTVRLLAIAYDSATGAQLWRRIYHGPNDNYDTASSVVVSPDGSRVVVAGDSAPNGTYDSLVIAFDATTGSTDWIGHGAALHASDLAMSPDGSRVFVAGENSDGNGATTALDSATGIPQWTTVTAVNLGYVISRRLVVSSDGAHLFMTGVEQSSGQSMDFITAAFDVATGSQVWATAFDSPTHRDDSASLLAVAPDGATVYVSGSSGRQFVTVAYDATTGGQRWSRAYNSHEKGTDTALGIAVDADAVFVTGASPSAISNDAVTVAYDPATGMPRWVSRYDGAAGGADQGSAVVADPTGHRLFVVGSTTPVSGGTEFLTLAYATAS